MSNSTKNTIKRYIYNKKSAYNTIVDTFVRNESPSIYGEPLSINKSGKVISGKSPNFKLIAKIEKIRKNI